MPFLSPSILKVYGIIPYYLLLLYSYTTIWHDLDSSLYILYDQRPTTNRPSKIQRNFKIDISIPMRFHETIRIWYLAWRDP